MSNYITYVVNSNRPKNIKFQMFMLKLCSLMSWCLLYIFGLETCHITPELWLCAMFYHNSLHLCIICALKWQLKWIFHNVKRSFDSLGHMGYFKSWFGKTVFASQANTTLLEPSTGKIWQWGTTKIVQIVFWCIFCELLQINYWTEVKIILSVKNFSGHQYIWI